MASAAQSPIRSDFCNSHGKSKFTAYGRVALSTGGGTETVTVQGAAVNDIVILSLEVDDGGTPITKLIGAISAANTLTIVRTDDGSSTDTGVCSYLIIRPTA